VTRATGPQGPQGPAGIDMSAFNDVLRRASEIVSWVEDIKALAEEGNMFSLMLDLAKLDYQESAKLTQWERENRTALACPHGVCSAVAREPIGPWEDPPEAMREALRRNLNERLAEEAQ
jgi:hypothetical protein